MTKIRYTSSFEALLCHFVIDLKELELERVQLRKHTVEGEGGAIKKQEDGEQSRLSSKVKLD